MSEQHIELDNSYRFRYFDWEKAKTFYYVAKLGSFTKAAEVLRTLYLLSTQYMRLICWKRQREVVSYLCPFRACHKDLTLSVPLSGFKTERYLMTSKVSDHAFHKVG